MERIRLSELSISGNVLGEALSERYPDSVFRIKPKIRTLLLQEKGSDFLGLVHLQGLEPWAHWLRELQIRFSSMSNCVEHFKICLSIVVLWPFYLCVLRIVCTMCIHYPGGPMCKKCAKMCSGLWRWKKLEFNHFYRKWILRTFCLVQFHFLHDSKLHHPHRFSGKGLDRLNGHPSCALCMTGGYF